MKSNPTRAVAIIYFGPQTYVPAFSLPTVLPAAVILRVGQGRLSARTTADSRLRVTASRPVEKPGQASSLFA
jgi:hypothetical protein